MLTSVGLRVDKELHPNGANYKIEDEGSITMGLTLFDWTKFRAGLSTYIATHF